MAGRDSGAAPLSPHPEFFDAAPVIVMRDPLAEFLGAARDGRMEYRYRDAVALAGHSCPTVAAAFLMTRAAVNTLYPGSVPVRGAIRTEFHDDRLAGTTGVMANVVRLITGATDDDGFKGIGGRFDRRRLLAFGVPMDAQMRFTRVDTGATAEVSARLDAVPLDPQVRGLLPRCLTGNASADEMQCFRTLWQARVKRLLLDHADDFTVFPVTLRRAS